MNVVTGPSRLDKITPERKKNMFDKTGSALQDKPSYLLQMNNFKVWATHLQQGTTKSNVEPTSRVGEKDVPYLKDCSDYPPEEYC